MRFIYIKIYVFAVYILYSSKSSSKLFFKKDILKLKLGKYDSLFSDYDNNFDKDFNSKTSKIPLQARILKKHQMINILFGKFY